MSIYIEQITKICINNKYTKWYISIVNNASNRTSTGYTEKHHILPRCICTTEQTKDKENIAILTAREHFICHWLLCKMFDNNIKHKMKYAFGAFFMDKTKSRTLSSRQFETIKIHFAEASSIRNKGHKYLVGIPKTAEHRENLSVSRKRSDAFKSASLNNLQKASEQNRGKKRPEHSTRMKELNKHYYSTPYGIFSNHDIKEGKVPLPSTMIYHWCRKSTDVITARALIAFKQHNHFELPLEWIGKTRKEVGFYALGRNIVSKKDTM